MASFASHARDEMDLRIGSFPEALADLGPECATLVVADPPWGELDTWDDVSLFAQRVLRPGGTVLAYIGSRHCFEALTRLERHLKPVRLAFLPSLHASTWDEEVRSHVSGSFIAILVKGRFDPPGPWSNMVGGPIASQLHPFQRPLANVRHYVEAFSRPGDLVIDPFLGGGTTAVASALLGRRFIGCDRNPSAVEATSMRLRELRANRRG